MLRKKDFDSNVRRIVKAIRKQGMDEFGTCCIRMSEKLGEEVMTFRDKKRKTYIYYLNIELQNKTWKDEDGCHWYYRVNDIFHSHQSDKDEGGYCLVFRLEEGHYY